MKALTRVALILGALTLFAVGASACELSFTLVDSSGSSRTIVPGKTVSLNRGETHCLIVKFTEDHGNCKVPPEETDFLLEEEKWKSSKDYLPLQLLSSTTWKDTGSRSHETELTFKAAQAGNWELEVIRECEKKGGYDEYLLFSVR